MWRHHEEGAELAHNKEGCMVLWCARRKKQNIGLRPGLLHGGRLPAALLAGPGLAADVLILVVVVVVVVVVVLLLLLLLVLLSLVALLLDLVLLL